MLIIISLFRSTATLYFVCFLLVYLSFVNLFDNSFILLFPLRRFDLASELRVMIL